MRLLLALVLVLVLRAPILLSKSRVVSSEGARLDKRYVLLARSEPMLGVAHEELREEHSAGGGHVGGEEEGDLARVDAEYAPLELLRDVACRLYKGASG